MKKSKKILVVGAGGHSKEVISYCRRLKLPLLGCLDDFKKGTFEDLEIFSFEELHKKNSENFLYHLSLGDNALRKKFFERLQVLPSQTAAINLIHPSAQLGNNTILGSGNLFAPNTILTSNIQVGDHCIFNVKASISHDCKIDNFVNINPNVTICGNVSIGEGTFIGASATIIQNIKIGKWVTVGAGSVVIADVPDYSTVVGVPAKPILKLKVNHG